MPGRRNPSDLLEDQAALRALMDGLVRLEEELNTQRGSIEARKRGYFTPDEDDRVRRMLLAYRNHRLALYEIIHRHADYDVLEDPGERLASFLLAFAPGNMVG